MSNKTGITLTMVMVISLDGIISQGLYQDSFEWTSLEDKEHFLSFIKTKMNVIMGRTTFESINNHPYDQVKHFVLTSDKMLHQKKDNNQIEYLSETPQNIVDYLYKQGIDDIALLGGAYTNTQFLKAGLVDYLWLTIEPKIFGQGIKFAVEQLNIDLKLLESKRLNAQGTLLLHYKVIT